MKEGRSSLLDSRHGAVQMDRAIINYSYIIIYTSDSPAMSI